MVGGVPVTLNALPLLAEPLTITITLPDVAPFGTGTAMLAELQLVGVACVPLNVTVLVPWVAPKFVPVIVIDVPMAPEFTDKLVIFGPDPDALVAAKNTALLVMPPTVTTTSPEVAPLGTGATIDVAAQLVGVAVVPLNVKVLAPCVDPKFAPTIDIVVPTAPEEGDRVPIIGTTEPSWYNSAFDTYPELFAPPATSTRPVPSNVAVWDTRA
jgi:hypothetical protein